MSTSRSRSVGNGECVQSAIAGVGSFLPSRVFTTADVEERLRLSSGAHAIPSSFGSMLRRTGVIERRYVEAGQNASDLAARAAKAALEEADFEPRDVPLLIFASSSQDLIEPATAHLVNDKLGSADTAFDVKNACNSFLSGMQVADSLIRAGQFDRALVCTGEAPSLVVNWSATTRRELKDAFGGYTLGDAGAAVVLERRADATGIDHVLFRSGSDLWDLCTVRGGGTMHQYDPEHRHFRVDGNMLRASFAEWGRIALEEMLEPTGTTFDDYDVVLVHQVTGAFLDDFLEITGLPADRTVPIVNRLGNIASASIPVQLDRARKSGRLGPGNRALIIGLGAGISLGIMTVQM